MNETETHLDPAANNTVAALQEEIRALRTLIAGAVTVLVLLSFSLNVYFLMQDNILSNEANEAQRAAMEFNVTFTPGFHEVWTRLQTFGRTHPDLKPILDKYAPHIEFRTNNTTVK